VGLERAAEEVQSEEPASELWEREARKEEKRLDVDEQGEVSRTEGRGATASHLQADRGRGGQWPGRVVGTPP